MARYPEIGGERGTRSAITPVRTLIERDERTIAIPDQVFLDQVVKRSRARHTRDQVETSR